MRPQYAIGQSTAERAQLEGQAAARVQAALVSARAGTAGLAQLGEAFELATKLNLPAARLELGAHIRAAVSPPSSFIGGAVRTTGIAIGLGVIAGIATHFVLVGIGQRRPEIHHTRSWN